MRLFLILLLGFAAACDRDHDRDHGAEQHGHDEDTRDDGHGDEGHEQGGHEVHEPKMGGVLVDLDHLVQVEFVLDREAGRLTAYIWDGHVEHGVEIDQETLAVRLGDFDLTLKKRKSELTGTRYEVVDERLKTQAELAGRLAELNALDETWTDVGFKLK